MQLPDRDWTFYNLWNERKLTPEQTVLVLPARLRAVIKEAAGIVGAIEGTIVINRCSSPDTESASALASKAIERLEEVKDSICGDTFVLMGARRPKNAAEELAEIEAYKAGRDNAGGT